ncbi:MAG: guanylate kinase [Selenomonadaceae bacterium]|nr:guanylate kinase [Selenomonadaceae bacterium]
MENKIYALVGPHASGKSRFAGELQAMGLHYIPYYTTAPSNKPEPAAGQVPISLTIEKLEFFKTDFIAKDTYKGNYVGIKKSDVLDAISNHRASVVILTPSEIKQLSSLLKGTLETIYLMSDYVVIVERMLQLGHNNDEIKYHLEYAENNSEFDLWKTARHVVKNTGDPADVMRQLMAIIGLTVPADPQQVKEILGK